MNQTQKADVVKAFGSAAGTAPFIVVAEYRGTKVAEVNAFRRELEKHGLRYKVIKNTLARRAFAEIGVNGLDGKLKGMTGIVLSTEDAVGSAKVLKDALKEVPHMQVRAGFFDNSVFDKDAIKVVSEMPSREDLLAKLLATLQEGPRQLVSVIQAPARDLLQLLKNYENKFTAQSPSAEYVIDRINNGLYK